MEDTAKDKKEMQAILSCMVEGVVVIDKNETIRIVSDPTVQMLDLRSRRIIGRPYWEVIRNERVIEAIRKVFEKKEVVRAELSTFLPKEQYFSMRVSPVLGDDGEISSITAVFHDISELKRLETIRSEFVANVSHELKTPLTSIKGFIETLESGALQDKDKAERFLAIIRKQTEQLENLVEDILKLSVLESRELKLSKTKIDLKALIERVVSDYSEDLKKKEQRYEFRSPQKLAVLGDPKKLEQLIANLMSNAIKYTPQGGKVAISVWLEGDEVRIDVTDTGAGIAPEHLSRIFERFYRVNKDRSKEEEGTGLGLAIVKHIAQAHNGRISVESREGHGSTFSVFLPAGLPK
jgi:two-component system phosphate regulon sensor histidine kinase PhoR